MRRLFVIHICLPLFFSLSATAKTVEIKSTIKSIPTFQELASASPKSRKKYLSGLVKVVNHKDFKFLDKLLVSTNKKYQKKCFYGIYGSNKWSSYKRNRKSCKQNLNSASAFFVDPKNESVWEILRLGINLTCLKSSACKRFLTSQNKIKEKSLVWFMVGTK